MTTKGTELQRISIKMLSIIINNQRWNLKFRAGIQYYLYGFLCLTVQNMGQHYVSLTSGKICPMHLSSCFQGGGAGQTSLQKSFVVLSSYLSTFTFSLLADSIVH